MLASGHAEHVPGTVSAPLTADADAAGNGGDLGHPVIADLTVIPFFAGVLFTWRTPGEAEQFAELLGHAQRLGSIGGWEEQLAAGTIRWTDSAFALFGLDPAQAAPIPIAQLHSFVIAADRAPVRRFQESLLQRREPAVAVFRIVRPGDTAIRQIRIFAEPVVVDDALVALRGAFQDVSAQYHTQVALAATRDQLADSEQRAAEEHQLALRLQQAIMAQDEPPVAAARVDIAVRYRPVEPGHLVGGDWYDVLTLPGDDLLIVVGDITGHGIDAVTGMVAARNALRGLAATEEGPAELLGHLNYAACHLTEGIAGTVVCGRYDPQTRVLRWARAGHLPPVLVRDGAARALPLPDGVLLGLDPDAAVRGGPHPAPGRRHPAAVHRRADRAPSAKIAARPRPRRPVRGGQHPAPGRRHPAAVHRRSDRAPFRLDQRRAARLHGRGRPGRPGRPVARGPHPRRRDIGHRRRRLPGRHADRLARARILTRPGGESAMRKRRAPASPRGAACPVLAPARRRRPAPRWSRMATTSA